MTMLDCISPLNGKNTPKKKTTTKKLRLHRNEGATWGRASPAHESLIGQKSYPEGGGVSYLHSFIHSFLTASRGKEQQPWSIFVWLVCVILFIWLMYQRLLCHQKMHFSSSSAVAESYSFFFYCMFIVAVSEQVPQMGQVWTHLMKHWAFHSLFIILHFDSCMRRTFQICHDKMMHVALWIIKQ